MGKITRRICTRDIKNQKENREEDLVCKIVCKMKKKRNLEKHREWLKNEKRMSKQSVEDGLENQVISLELKNVTSEMF